MFARHFVKGRAIPEIIHVGSMELHFLRDKHDTNGSLDLFEMTVPGGGNMPAAHYHRDWDETVYGLTGTLGVTVDGTTHSFEPGATMFIRRGAVHSFNNTSLPDTAKMHEIMRHCLVPA